MPFPSLSPPLLLHLKYLCFISPFYHPHLHRCLHLMKISLKSDYVPLVKCVGTTQRPIERSIHPSFTIASLVLSLGGEDAEGDPGSEIAPHGRDKGICHCRLYS